MYTTRYHHRRRSQSNTTRSLVVFLLIASFGILFAGCRGPEAEEHTDEFVFTEEDMVRLSGDSPDVFQESGATNADEEVLDLQLPSSPESPPVLDLSLAKKYGAIRSASGEAGEDLYRVVNDFLNVRSEPSVTAPLVVRLERGALLHVIEFTDAAWAKVEAGGKEGYVAQRYIAKLTSEDRLAEEKKKYDGLYFVDFGFLNVRKDADAQSEKLGELPGQAIVRPISMDTVWARIPFSGKEGYVSAEYLSPFLPNFLVRQDTYMLPILRYDLSIQGALEGMTNHLTQLKSRGIKLLTLRDFHDLLLKQEERDVRLDPNSVILTVSGITPETIKGLSDALSASKISATLFIETRFIGLEGITEKTALTLLANGHDLQSAGHTGDDLRSLTNAQVDLELGQSRRILEDLTKRPVYAVAYPRGGVNDRIAGRAAEAGYLFGVGPAPESAFNRDQFLRLPSFQITGDMTADEVVKIAKGEGDTAPAKQEIGGGEL